MVQAEIIKSTKIRKSTTMFIAPQELFENEWYIERKGSLYKCRVIRIENYLQERSNEYKQKVVAEVATEGRISFNLFNAYRSVEDYKNQKITYSSQSFCASCYMHQSMFNIGGTREGVDKVINHYIAKRPFCHHNNDWNSLKTYEWNGTRAVEVDFELSNIIIQDENAIYFKDYDINQHIDSYYYTKQECEQCNEIDVVEFEKPTKDNKKELLSLLDELLTSCQDARDTINKIRMLVGENKLNGVPTKLDDDEITQDLLSFWNENIHAIQVFCLE